MLSRSRDNTEATRWARPSCRFVCFVIVLIVSQVGCRGTKLTGNDKKYDLLEAELRTRERELIEARSELNHLRLLTDTYQRQPAVWDTQPAFAQRANTETQVATMPLRDITLGTGTGGVDDDGLPGDESLMVAIVPKDGDGTVVKIPGTVVVSAYEIDGRGLKHQIGQWDVTADQLRRSWKSGLLSNGYFVPLQWDKAPMNNRLRVLIKFRTLDGTTFEADKDVSVRPLPGLPMKGTNIPPTQLPVFPLNPSLAPLPNFPQPTAPAIAVPPNFGGAEELPPPRGSDGLPAARFKSFRVS